MSKKLLGQMSILLCLLTLSCQIGPPNPLSGRWTEFTQTDGLVSDEVSAVAVDSYGNAWFATLDKGVSRRSVDGQWASYSSADGLGANRIPDVAIDHLNRVWAATTGGGISRYDGTRWQTFDSTNSALPDNYPIDLAVNEDNTIWVLSTGGLSVIHPDDTIEYIGEPFGQTASSFHCLDIDNEGRIWVAAWGPASLAQYDSAVKQWNVIGAIDQHIQMPKKFSSSTDLWDLAVDPQGHLWLASNSIVEFDGTAWQVYNPEYPPSSIFIDPDGYKWIGLFGGDLLVLSPDDKSRWLYDAGAWGSGLNGWTIQDVAYDPTGSLWFATDNGVLQLVKTK